MIEEENKRSFLYFDEKSNFHKAVLILSLTVAFSNRVGYFVLPNKVTYLFVLFWICLAALKCFKLRNTHIRDARSILCRIFFRGNFLIKLYIYIYTIVLIVLGITESRFFTSNLQTFIAALSAISVFYLFGKCAFDCSLMALTLSYGIAVISSIVSGRWNFEFHDMAFATGLLLIYYFILKEEYRKRDVIWTMMSLLVTVIAFKRIGIAALILIFFADLVIKLFGLKLQNTVIILGNLLFILVIYLYIYLALNDELSSIIMGVGINMKGRNYYYGILKEYASFSVTYLGMGRNALATMLTNEYRYMNVGNLHSDILRMYVECGFVVYFLWIYNYLIHLPNVIRTRFGNKAYKAFMLCTWYLFITYFTDNTELYLVTQYFYILVLVHYIYSDRASWEIGREGVTKPRGF